MKNFYSKAVSVQKFQASQLSDLKSYQNKIKLRAREYRNKATILTTECLLCSSKDSKPFLKVFNYQYLQCNKCTHVYLQKRLSEADLIHFYNTSSEYAATYVEKKQLEYRLEHIATPKVQFVMRQLPKKNKGAWLDLGAAVGDVLEAVTQYPGWSATGLELSPDSIKVGKKTWQLDLREQILADFLENNKNRLFDVVSAFGYFGLIADPLAELQRVKKILKKDGCIVIGDSNADSVSTILQQSFSEMTMRHLVPPNTQHAFTEKSLLTILKKLDFKPLAIWRFGLDFTEFLKYFSLLKPGFEATAIYEYLSANANTFQTVVDRNKKSDYMIVVAQKK